MSCFCHCLNVSAYDILIPIGLCDKIILNDNQSEAMSRIMNKPFSKIPYLKGERITLMALDKSDADSLRKLTEDDEVYRYLPTFLYEKKYSLSQHVQYGQTSIFSIPMSANCFALISLRSNRKPPSPLEGE